MAKTTQDLVTRVLQKLVSLEPGQDPSSEDDAFITDVWATVNANLRVEKISTWTDNSIPNEVFEPLANYLKEYLWEEYKGARQNNAAFVDAALPKLRAAVAKRYMGNPVKADYY